MFKPAERLQDFPAACFGVGEPEGSFSREPAVRTGEPGGGGCSQCLFCALGQRHDPEKPVRFLRGEPAVFPPPLEYPLGDPDD